MGPGGVFAILDTAPNAFVSMTPQGQVAFWNARAEQLFGFSKQEAIGSSLADLIIPERHHPTLWQELERLSSGGEPIVARRVELLARRRAGDELNVTATISAVRDGERDVLLHAFVEDVSEQQRIDSERERLLAGLAALASHDPLTGLINRRVWDEELARERSRAARGGYEFTVALIDLDRFTGFNQIHGRIAANDLLRDTAIAWRGLLRDTDVLARIGGDEFGLLLPACRSGNAPVIQRVLTSVASEQTVSVGLATWTREEPSESLIRRAHTALAVAKHEGGNRSVVEESLL